MDATALRWVLAIIGIVVVAAVYLYSAYQNKARRSAAIRTFTHAEVESGFIEDEELRKELSSINAMMDGDLTDTEITDIKINATEPPLDLTSTPTIAGLELPSAVCELKADQCIVHILKPADNRRLSAQQMLDAFNQTGFKLNDEFMFRLEDYPEVDFHIMNLSASGSFEGIDQPPAAEASEFSSKGLVCCVNMAGCRQPLEGYEVMLKKVDELVRMLNLKVYSQELELLTLQHVTDIRKQLLG